MEELYNVAREVVVVTVVTKSGQILIMRTETDLVLGR